MSGEAIGEAIIYVMETWAIRGVKTIEYVSRYRVIGIVIGIK